VFGNQVCRDPAGLRLPAVSGAVVSAWAGYSTNRHTMDMRITVPSLYKVIAPGIERREDAGRRHKVAYSFQFTQPAFPGSLAIGVQGDPVQASSEGRRPGCISTTRRRPWTAPYGEETRKGDVLLDQASTACRRRPT